MTRHLPEQKRREQILAAARKCFVERGYHPTRMEDIASSAGLSKGGVYFHFQSKQEVFDALVSEEFERSMAVLKQVAGGASPVAEKMQVLGAHYLEYFSSSPDAPRFFIVMGEMALRDEALAQRLLDMQQAFVTEVARLVDQGVQEGVLRATDSFAVAALLKALLDGAEGMLALRYPMELPRLLGIALDVLMNGLGKVPAAR